MALFLASSIDGFKLDLFSLTAVSGNRFSSALLQPWLVTTAVAKAVDQSQSRPERKRQYIFHDRSVHM